MTPARFAKSPCFQAFFALFAHPECRVFAQFRAIARGGLFLISAHPSLKTPSAAAIHFDRAASALHATWNGLPARSQACGNSRPTARDRNPIRKTHVNRDVRRAPHDSRSNEARQPFEAVHRSDRAPATLALAFPRSTVCQWKTPCSRSLTSRDRRYGESIPTGSSINNLSYSYSMST
jgi:hypothetical protein